MTSKSKEKTRSPATGHSSRAETPGSACAPQNETQNSSIVNPPAPEGAADQTTFPVEAKPAASSDDTSNACKDGVELRGTSTSPQSAADDQHVCPTKTCAQVFTTSNSLKQHRKSGCCTNKPYRCPQCEGPRRFATEAELTKHLRSSHRPPKSHDKKSKKPEPKAPSDGGKPPSSASAQIAELEVQLAALRASSPPPTPSGAPSGGAPTPPDGGGDDDPVEPGSYVDNSDGYRVLVTPCSSFIFEGTPHQPSLRLADEPSSRFPVQIDNASRSDFSLAVQHAPLAYQALYTFGTAYAHQEELDFKTMFSLQDEHTRPSPADLPDLILTVDFAQHGDCGFFFPSHKPDTKQESVVWITKPVLGDPHGRREVVFAQHDSQTTKPTTTFRSVVPCTRFERVVRCGAFCIIDTRKPIDISVDFEICTMQTLLNAGPAIDRDINARADYLRPPTQRLVLRHWLLGNTSRFRRANNVTHLYDQSAILAFIRGSAEERQCGSAFHVLLNTIPDIITDTAHAASFLSRRSDLHDHTAALQESSTPFSISSIPYWISSVFSPEYWYSRTPMTQLENNSRKGVAPPVNGNGLRNLAIGVGAVAAVWFGARSFYSETGVLNRFYRAYREAGPQQPRLLVSAATKSAVAHIPANLLLEGCTTAAERALDIAADVANDDSIVVQIPSFFQRLRKATQGAPFSSPFHRAWDATISPSACLLPMPPRSFDNQPTSFISYDTLAILVMPVIEEYLKSSGIVSTTQFIVLENLITLGSSISNGSVPSLNDMLALPADARPDVLVGAIFNFTLYRTPSILLHCATHVIRNIVPGQLGLPLSVLAHSTFNSYQLGRTRALATQQDIMLLQANIPNPGYAALAVSTLACLLCELRSPGTTHSQYHHFVRLHDENLIDSSPPICVEILTEQDFTHGPAPTQSTLALPPPEALRGTMTITRDGTKVDPYNLHALTGDRFLIEREQKRMFPIIMTNATLFSPATTPVNMAVAICHRVLANPHHQLMCELFGTDHGNNWSVQDHRACERVLQAYWTPVSRFHLAHWLPGVELPPLPTLEEVITDGSYPSSKVKSYLSALDDLRSGCRRSRKTLQFVKGNETLKVKEGVAIDPKLLTTYSEWTYSMIRSDEAERHYTHYGMMAVGGKLKPRLISASDKKYIVELVPWAKYDSKLLKSLYHPDRTVSIDGFPVKIIVAHGAQHRDLDAYGQLLQEFQGLLIILCGDDSIIRVPLDMQTKHGNLRFNIGGLGAAFLSSAAFYCGYIYLEMDMVKCDHSQTQAAKDHVCDLRRECGYPQHILDLIDRDAHEFGQARCGGYQFRVKTTTVQTKSGSAETTVANCANVAVELEAPLLSMYYVSDSKSESYGSYPFRKVLFPHLCGGLRDPSCDGTTGPFDRVLLRDLQRQLGVDTTISVHGNLEDATFLRGWWCQAEHLDGTRCMTWRPLPSALLKFGKSLRDPRITQRHKGDPSSLTFRELVGRQAVGIAVSNGFIEESYPILGPYLSALRRAGLASTSQLLESEEVAAAYQASRDKYNVITIEDNVIIDRDAVIDQIVNRYGLCVDEILEVEDMMRQIDILPAFISHPLFHSLAVADYDIQCSITNGVKQGTSSSA